MIESLSEQKEKIAKLQDALRRKNQEPNVVVVLAKIIALKSNEDSDKLIDELLREQENLVKENQRLKKENLTLRSQLV